MKKLAIIGNHPDTRDKAPWSDETYDIWIFNESANADWCKRWTACFQIHKPDIYRGFNTKDPHHWEWLQKKHGKPIFMQAKDDLVPDCVVYPLQEIIQKAGIKYFSATICYALALAWYWNYDQVDIYGIELNTESEYSRQAEAFRYWVGFLKGAGINLSLHSGQRLFEVALYGYESFPVLESEYFKQRVALAEQMKIKAEKVVKPARLILEIILSKREFSKFPEAVEKYKKLAQFFGNCAGEMSEAGYYIKTGERQADRQEFEKRIKLAQIGDDHFIGYEELNISMNKTAGIVDYIFSQFQSQPENMETLKQLTGLMDQLGSLAYELGIREGMTAENRVYLSEFDHLLDLNTPK